MASASSSVSRCGLLTNMVGYGKDWVGQWLLQKPQAAQGAEVPGLGLCPVAHEVIEVLLGDRVLDRRG